MPVSVESGHQLLQVVIAVIRIRQVFEGGDDGGAPPDKPVTSSARRATRD
jgi:hypothetical protein